MTETKKTLRTNKLMKEQKELKNEKDNERSPIRKIERMKEIQIKAGKDRTN